ncbi:hypothetical protein DRN72_02320 [Methanosarcinales archaeon]|nr:MAG: hypothetical protein DRN72_02320 [Methanosarcinales archaeon]
MTSSGFGRFERWFTVYVAFCILLGLFIGYLNPDVGTTLEKLPSIFGVSIALIGYIWLMIIPLMLRVDTTDLTIQHRHIVFLMIAVWILKPLIFSYTAYLIINKALFIFFPSYSTYFVIGLILLGCAPTPPLFFTLVELTGADTSLAKNLFSINILLAILLYPLVAYFLLSKFAIPFPLTHLYMYSLIILVIPLLLVFVLKRVVIERKGRAWYRNVFFPKMDALGVATYFAIIIVIFAVNSEFVLRMPSIISILAVPIIISIILSFFVSSTFAPLTKSGMMSGVLGSISSYEVAVAMGVALLGITSPALLSLSLYPLMEVPIITGCIVVSKKIFMKRYALHQRR